MVAGQKGAEQREKIRLLLIAPSYTIKLDMRKTVTLDDDVNTYLREEMKKTGKTLSATFNDAIRRGFEYEELVENGLLTPEESLSISSKKSDSHE